MPNRGIIVSHHSALAYWTHLQEQGIAPSDLARADAIPEREALGIRALKAASVPSALFDDERIDLLVEDGNSRRNSKRVRSHVCSRLPPSGALIQASPHAFVCTPEYAFVQLALELSLPRLVMLGNSLCSERIVRKGREWVTLPPLTTTKRLAEFLDSCAGIYGICNARRALPYLRDGSASPMESALAIALGFPRRLGGCGFGMPLFNRPVGILHGQRSLKCDLIWEDARVGIEYDSEAHHAGYESAQQDSWRRSTFLAAGITVLSATSSQFRNVDNLSTLAAALERTIFGEPRRSRAPAWRGKCQRLIRELLACLGGFRAENPSPRTA